VGQLKDNLIAVSGALVAVCIGALVFVTVVMPFVFPVILAAAALATWRIQRRSTPRAGPPRRYVEAERAARTAATAAV
jgi:hypothetical protein